jgi:hypothetical protein
MINRLVEDAARGAADRLLAEEPGDDAGRVRLAYLRVLAREPGREEIADSLAFLRSLNREGDTAYRWSVLLQALLASAEFRYLR